MDAGGHGNPAGLSAVCGIDLGSLHTPAYVAWLRRGVFHLDMYLPSLDRPLPPAPRGYGSPAYIAIDAPQGLPRRGSGRRLADAAAGTPTNIMPPDREALGRWRLYRGLIEAGIELFWAVYERRLGVIPGLPSEISQPVVLETYPRHVIRKLWPRLRIPAKRRQPLAYIDALWPLIRALGYRCPGLVRPTVDQVDAMLCALAAQACLDAGGWADLAVGAPPIVDTQARVLREGFIVAAAKR